MSAVLSDFERGAEGRAKHRALIMQILVKFPGGLTTQQVLAKVTEWYGYSFLVDNRLRELRALAWVVSEKGADGLIRWKLKQ
jgi:hypothetical protein